MKASSLIISRLTATLCRLLSTLRDARYRTPRKTRFRLAGYAFAGRESNPLDRDERFQLMLPPPQDLAWRYKNGSLSGPVPSAAPSKRPTRFSTPAVSSDNSGSFNAK